MSGCVDRQAEEAMTGGTSAKDGRTKVFGGILLGGHLWCSLRVKQTNWRLSVRSQLIASTCKQRERNRSRWLCVCVCLVARQESIDFMASLDRLLSCKLSCSVASSSNENRVDGGGGSSVAGGFLALAGQRVRPERRGGRR